MIKPTTGSHYISSRRDLVHGSLTFHVTVVGVLANGTVLAKQTGVEYPGGEIKTTNLDLEIANFADRYTLVGAS